MDFVLLPRISHVSLGIMTMQPSVKKKKIGLRLKPRLLFLFPLYFFVKLTGKGTSLCDKKLMLART